VYPDDAADTETLLRHADVAMYSAKAAGGGRLAFHQQPGASVSRRTSLSAQLRRAIERSELELHYQPIWGIRGQRGISGVEALLRWRHPDRGLLLPEAFISLAEQGSAGDELLGWVLAAACRQAREWLLAGLLPRLSVNVSPQQLLAPGYASRFLEQVAGHELTPGNFMIELTESAWTVDAAETLSVVADLRAAGTRLAIDDFGAGYSSLSRLCELDFDVIKIDRALLVDVPANRTANAVLRAIVDLAQACGCTIVAEGVESEDQVVYLAEHGIGQAQGFVLGFPIPGPALTPVLTQHLIDGRAAA
jgi:EAL domain-containing protein (putative c-di-GMP-specific phosphodiesterase class I)